MDIVAEFLDQKLSHVVAKFFVLRYAAVKDSILCADNFPIKN